MSLLRGFNWKCRYQPKDGNLLNQFYIPALGCAKRYDRTTGFFSADTLAAATWAVEELVKNEGRMRLIVGCTLEEPEVKAIVKGEALLEDEVSRKLLAYPLKGGDKLVTDGLEFLAWLVANGYLEVRVAVLCEGPSRLPISGTAIFHEKSGTIEDANGDRLSFNGSVNETTAGWTKNWESFHVFRSWTGDLEHVESQEESFRTLWADEDECARVLALAGPVKDALLEHLPENGRMPARLQMAVEPSPSPSPSPVCAPDVDPYEEVWSLIREAPAETGDESTGLATAAVTPWPHQTEAFCRMYRNWPPRLLIADEVGLGKTVQAGMLLRQAWLAGRAKRILVMAPPSVLKQWQLELREKFNLNVPVYDAGKLQWCPSPFLGENTEQPVGDDDWHKEPFLLVSSYLVRRKERREQIVKEAEPWDIVVLDEAHHARRRDSLRGLEKNDPNNLLRLMRAMMKAKKAKGLVLLTATPMQVAPIEVWDLLSLLGLPSNWDAQSFLDFYEYARHPNLGIDVLCVMAKMARSMEKRLGRKLDVDSVVRLQTEPDTFVADKVLNALHSESSIPLRTLEVEEKALAQRVMKSMAPTRTLISRHTRELLRRYRKEGALKSNIAERKVSDVLVPMTLEERSLYEAVEDYISTTYDKASEKERVAVGFVMTIYRRRLASSFYALAQTLKGRLEKIESKAQLLSLLNVEDAPDDDTDDELELDAVPDFTEEKEEIRSLLERIGELPIDSKADHLLKVLKQLSKAGYEQAIVFTQYTDTVDDLRELVTKKYGNRHVLCYSGRGGERKTHGGWEVISREDTKRLFREGEAKVLICSDAAAEGLNFQYCGALINYDMPWNPMRVEQRIGRIDRLGQKYDSIRIVNLMYEDTVEADVYCKLRDRIGLFGAFVGRLQPILSKLPKTFKELTMKPRWQQEQAREEAKATLDKEIADNEANGFDLDDNESLRLEVPVQKKPLYDLKFLGKVLADPKLQPKGCIIKPQFGRAYSYHAPGRMDPVWVTTDPVFYEEHSESCELWSPGSPAFPWKKEKM